MSSIVNVNGVSIRVVTGAAKPYRTANAAFKTLEAAVESVGKFAAQCASDRMSQTAQVAEMMQKQRRELGQSC